MNAYETILMILSVTSYGGMLGFLLCTLISFMCRRYLLTPTEYSILTFSHHVHHASPGHLRFQDMRLASWGFAYAPTVYFGPHLTTIRTAYP